MGVSAYSALPARAFQVTRTTTTTTSRQKDAVLSIHQPTRGAILRHVSLRATVSSSSTSSGTVGYESDQQIFALLDELKITPPWVDNDGTTDDSTLSSSLVPSSCDTRTFNYVMRQLAESGVSFAGQSAEGILMYMLEQSNNQGRPHLQPDSLTLNTVLDAHSKSRRSKNSRNKQASANAAYNLFVQWQDWYQSGKVADDVDRISYNTLISAFGKAGMPDMAERLFRQLQQQAEDRNDDKYQPDAVTYSALLHAYALAGQATKVGALFQQMQNHGPQPTIHSYNGVLYAYSKSDHPSAAEEFLQWWTEEDSEGPRPDVQSYNTVLHSLSRMPMTTATNTGGKDRLPRSSSKSTTTVSNTRRHDQNAAAIKNAERAQRLFDSIPRPDKISYTTLIRVLSYLSGKLALEAIDRVMDQAWRDAAIRVDAGFVSNVLYSVAQCSDDRSMPVFAERLVRDMLIRDVKTSIEVYNALLYCWLSSNDREAPKRSIEILAQIEDDKSLRPSVNTYTTVLSTLSKSRDPKSVDEAEAIVQRMERRGPTPNIKTYTSLIQNYGRSRLPDKAMRASQVLQKLKASNRTETMPNVICYNAVLNACEHTDPTDPVSAEEALKVACVTFDEIRAAPTLEPNHVTYGTFLGVLANLMPASSRQEIVELVFRRCCMEGLVSGLVLRKLANAVTNDDVFHELLKGHSSTRLPRSWTARVKDTKARDQDG